MMRAFDGAKKERDVAGCGRCMQGDVRGVVWSPGLHNGQYG